MVPYVLPAPKVGDEEPEGSERHEETGDQGAELVRQHLHRKVPAERAVDVGEAEGDPDGRQQYAGKTQPSLGPKGPRRRRAKRSEERREGTECVSTCRSRCSPRN